MPPHIELGKKGEELAAAWLTANGYTILHRNWRHGRYEVDRHPASRHPYHRSKMPEVDRLWSSGDQCEPKEDRQPAAGRLGLAIPLSRT